MDLSKAVTTIFELSCPFSQFFLCSSPIIHLGPYVISSRAELIVFYAIEVSTKTFDAVSVAVGNGYPDIFVKSYVFNRNMKPSADIDPR